MEYWTTDCYKDARSVSSVHNATVIKYTSLIKTTSSSQWNGMCASLINVLHARTRTRRHCQTNLPYTTSWKLQFCLLAKQLVPSILTVTTI